MKTNCIQSSEANGCGASTGWLKLFQLPEWLSFSFNRCCGFHDRHFEIGWSKEDADWDLLNCFYHSAFHSSPVQKWFKLILADFIFSCLQTRIAEKYYEQGM